MRNPFEIAFKGAIIILAVMCFFAFYAAFTDDGTYYETFVPDEESQKAWLSQMEVEENETLTADTLRKQCESNAITEEGLCIGYVLGFVEGVGYAPNFSICDNGSLRSSDQIEQIFKNYMEDNPQHWKKPRAPILGAALQSAFPCSDP